MIYSIQDILTKCKFYIHYNYDSEQSSGIIDVSTNKQTQHVLRWDAKKNELQIDDLAVPCSVIAAPSIAYLAFRNTLNTYNNFPSDFVSYRINNIPTNTFLFEPPMENEHITGANNLFALTLDIYSEGVRPDHIDLAKSHNLITELNSIIQYYLLHTGTSHVL